MEILTDSSSQKKSQLDNKKSQLIDSLGQKVLKLRAKLNSKKDQGINEKSGSLEKQKVKSTNESFEKKIHNLQSSLNKSKPPVKKLLPVTKQSLRKLTNAHKNPENILNNQQSTSSSIFPIKILQQDTSRNNPMVTETLIQRSPLRAPFTNLNIAPVRASFFSSSPQEENQKGTTKENNFVFSENLNNTI